MLNTAFGFVTEYKAEQSLEALKNMMTPTAKVRRNGEVKEIKAKNIVPGDILIIEQGDRISADGRLIDSDNLQVNESVLTGESETVSKDEDFLPDEELAVADRKNMVYMGTSVTRGNGEVLVTATGTDSEMGEISSLLEETDSEETPLEVKMNSLGKTLVKLTLVIAVIVTVIGIIAGKPVIDMIKTGIALAIAAVPEGLPIVSTITLAIGMNKMVKNNALVRRLPAVETLGSTTTICTDKTGTITENQMTLSDVYLGDNEIEVTGTGYKPVGEFKYKNDEEVDEKIKDNLDLLLKAGTLCSNAVVNKNKEGNWQVVGDPTEGALVTAAMKADYNREEMEEKGYERLGEVPFSSDIKYMGVSYNSPDDENFVFVKGAPSVVLNMCDSELKEEGESNLHENRIKELKDKNHKMAQNGLRVLALAYKKGSKAENEAEIKGVIDSDLVFLGLAGIMDPPRKEAKEAIKEAESAGIVTKMITGDQSDTALSIAEKVGIKNIEAGVITGQEIDKMDDKELSDYLKTNSVFSRVSPKNKLEIVESLNKSNEITAMTGDGVNDAPALKKADIGIAMGKRGTSVARNASDMVLLDDSFSTIVTAIKEGRVIFDNIKKFIYYLFSSNLSEIIFIFLGIVLQVPIPLLALQILWLNLVIDVFPALSLGWEVPEPNVMRRSPRDPNKSILNNAFKKKLLVHSALVALGPLVTYLIVLNSGYSVELSRTVSFAVLSFTQLFHVFDARRENKIGFDKSAFQNKYLWLAIVLSIISQLLAVYNPFLQKILNTVDIPLYLWPGISLGFIIPIIIIQILNLRNSKK